MSFASGGFSFVSSFSVMGGCCGFVLSDVDCDDSLPDE